MTDDALFHSTLIQRDVDVNIMFFSHLLRHGVVFRVITPPGSFHFITPWGYIRGFTVHAPHKKYTLVFKLSSFSLFVERSMKLLCFLSQRIILYFKFSYKLSFNFGN